MHGDWLNPYACCHKFANVSSAPGQQARSQTDDQLILYFLETSVAGFKHLTALFNLA